VGGAPVRQGQGLWVVAGLSVDSAVTTEEKRCLHQQTLAMQPSYLVQRSGYLGNKN